ncbi:MULTISPECIES: DUF7287 family protein [Halomicrobium]|uniref:Uncharacterized protein n=1 Tax=Halomicrobium mukohataei (strain ATCC 700874 / DSM 12286 / JCM 9738 / NCIMB 13541) TaxID=485914 RepID=C7NWP9_HALMD|nr:MULTISPECIES: hypothetical protein [Halomicrobium]ACV48259.1 hypothetical protein Hmuk_2146 [Halomicrobium mukohataei DSM 12286]
MLARDAVQKLRTVVERVQQPAELRRGAATKRAVRRRISHPLAFVGGVRLTVRKDKPTNDRGQTPQDFAVGVAVLLLTIIATFVFIQNSVVTTYDRPVSGDVQESADRVASYVVENYSVEDKDNILRYDSSDGIEQSLNRDTDSLDRLRAGAGLDVATDRRINLSINVTVVGSDALADGSRKPATGISGELTWGEAYKNQDGAASTARVVTLEDESTICSSNCLLVVRVW